LVSPLFKACCFQTMKTLWGVLRNSFTQVKYGSLSCHYFKSNCYSCLFGCGCVTCALVPPPPPSLTISTLALVGPVAYSSTINEEKEGEGQYLGVQNSIRCSGEILCNLHWELCCPACESAAKFKIISQRYYCCCVLCISFQSLYNTWQQATGSPSKPMSCHPTIRNSNQNSKQHKTATFITILLIN